jgi:hypothetical protein
MAAARGAGKVRGLPSLNEARAERRSAIVRGKYRLQGGLPQRLFLWVAILLGVSGVVYWKLEEGRLESQKNAVRATQRTIAQALEPQVIPQAERIEGLVKALAAKVEPHVADGVDLATIERAPSIYLRLRQQDATTTESIRKASAASLHDAFVACLFVREDAPDPTQGPPCKHSGDCAPGLLCNEFYVCTLPPKPYNLRLAYRALDVLGTGWSDQLHETSNEFEVRMKQRELEAVAHDDVPIAVQMMKSAKYLVVVLDEEPRAGLPPKLDPFETDEQRVQRVPHAARVGVWDLSDGSLELSFRTEVDGRLVTLGPRRNRTATNDAAQQRQANSCALALEAKERLRKK